MERKLPNRESSTTTRKQRNCRLPSSSTDISQYAFVCNSGALANTEPSPETVKLDTMHFAPCTLRNNASVKMHIRAVFFRSVSNKHGKQSTPYLALTGKLDQIPVPKRNTPSWVSRLPENQIHRKATRTWKVYRHLAASSYTMSREHPWLLAVDFRIERWQTRVLHLTKASMFLMLFSLAPVANRHTGSKLSAHDSYLVHRARSTWKS